MKSALDLEVESYADPGILSQICTMTLRPIKPLRFLRTLLDFGERRQYKIYLQLPFGLDLSDAIQQLRKCRI